MGVCQETFEEWDYYNKCINYAQLNHPNEKYKYNFINLTSWIKGCSKQFSEKDLKVEEDLYWNNLTVS